MPAHTNTASVVLDRVSFAWPDGSPRARRGLRRFRRRPHRPGRPQRLGQVHAAAPRSPENSTPSTGHIAATADVAYLPQRLTLDVERPVAELLGVRRRSPRCAPSSPATSTSATSTRSATTGTSRRARSGARRGGAAPGMLDRRVGELSGGEAVLTAIAGIRLREAAIALLDEPTNNLDRDARGRLAEMVRGWRGALVVVSHDLALLELMDDTAELYGTSCRCSAARTPSGARGWMPSRRLRGRRSGRPRRLVRARSASGSRPRRRSRRDRRRAARRRSRSECPASSRADASAPPRCRRASCARACGREATARARARCGGAAVRDDDGIRIDLPDPGVPAGAGSRRSATAGGRG